MIFGREMGVVKGVSQDVEFHQHAAMGSSGEDPSGSLGTNFGHIGKIGIHSLKLWPILMMALALVSGMAAPASAVEPAVAVGAAHTVALKSDGTVWAWGLGSYNGVSVSSLTPVQVVELNDAKAIGASPYNTIALKSDGTVWVCGMNFSGVLGLDPTLVGQETAPVQIAGLSNVVGVSIGGGTVGSHGLAVKSDGTVWAWGGNQEGQLGDGTTTSRFTVAQVTGLSDVVFVDAGQSHSVALKSDGTVWTWGANSRGQMGDGTRTKRLNAVQVPGLSGVVSLGTGADHSLALKSDGSVQGWGFNNYGQMGDGTYADRLSPFAVPGMGGVSVIGVGWNCSFAKKTDGTVYSWGENSQGALGDGGTANRLTPGVTAGVGDVIAMTSGHDFSIFLRSNGTICGSGPNTAGQLANGAPIFRSNPMQMPGIGPIASLAVSSFHGVALKSDGTLIAWGTNASGQLGDGTMIDRMTAVPVAGLSGVTSVSAGSGHTLARKADGTVWAWGHNYIGQVGDGTLVNRSSPVQVTGFTDIKEVKAGQGHSVILRTDGTVWAWGYNFSGQLGDGTTTSRPAAVQTTGLTGMAGIATGDAYTLALKADGTVWAWGRNAKGQLGDGSTSQRNTPVMVSGLTGVVGIAAGGQSSFAIKADGSVWAWGDDYAGQLGIGSATPQLLPVLVTSLTNVESIVCGSHHSIALKKDGSLQSWGNNGFGQLGDGTILTRRTPIALGGSDLGRNAKAFATGFSSFILKEDGTLLGFGSSAGGQLANGFITPYKTMQDAIGINLTRPAPVVEITSPANDTTVPLGSAKNVNATASFTDGLIDMVFFYADGVWLGEDNLAPFQYHYTPTSWGDIEIDAIAQGNDGSFSLLDKIRLKTPYDSEPDGLPDWWEMLHLGSTTGGADGDPDEDGYSNIEELALGSNPAVYTAAFADTDEDGMSDAYEIAHGLSVTEDDSLEDADGDRIPNIFEYKNGTSASDPNSRPASHYVIDPAHGADSGSDKIYSRIQEGLDDAMYPPWDDVLDEPGKTKPYRIIEIKTGTYRENLSVTNIPFLLLGELGAASGPTVIAATESYATVTLESASVLDGLVITHSAVATGGRGVDAPYYEWEPGEPERVKRRKLVNCVIKDNRGEEGGAIFADHSHLILSHCTLFRNGSTTISGGGVRQSGGSLDLSNSIVWGNTGAPGDTAFKQVMLEDGAVLHVSAAAPSILGDANAGSVPGWLVVDPKLTVSGWLRSDSPAINAGGAITDSVVQFDLNGESRPVGSSPDIGADEYRDANSVTDGDGVPDWAEGPDDNDGLLALDEYQLYGTHPSMADTDGDGLDDGSEVANGTNPLLNEDSDGDGMLDLWEYANSGGMGDLAPLDDLDEDGLNNLAEFQAQTNPNAKDSDGDLMDDKWEVDFGLDPNDPNDVQGDPDGDGITNLEEYRLSGFLPKILFNPSLANSDGIGGLDNVVDRDSDGLFDFWEFRYFQDPTSAVPTANPDNDGLNNLQEQAAGSSPLLADTDADGLPDHWEVSWGFNPALADSDADGLPDGKEDADGDGVSNLVEFGLGWDPLSTDTDNDGILDGVEDQDGDGLPDAWEFRYFGSATSAVPGEDPDGDTLSNQEEFAIGTDPTDLDTDDDSLADGFEHRNAGFDPLVPSLAAVLDADMDQDGLNTLEEQANSTNPAVADTDGDGVDDHTEVYAGTDPSDATSKPLNFSTYFGSPIVDTRVPDVGNLGTSFWNSEYSIQGHVGVYWWAWDLVPIGKVWRIQIGDKSVSHQASYLSDVTQFNIGLRGDRVHRVTAGPANGWYYPEWYWRRKSNLSSAKGFIRCADGNVGFIFQNPNSDLKLRSTGEEYLVPVKGAGYAATYQGNEVVGPRYRKIGLNGRPMADARPDEGAESDSLAEETYIDAFNLGLRHDTSYVHVPLEASDLSLSVTASASETHWSNRSGLRPHELLTSPFGISWSSNLCAYVETIETIGGISAEPVVVNVIDENGGSQRFGTKGTDVNGKQTFFSWPSSRVDNKTYLNTLKRVGNDLVLQKKHGNKLTYRPSKAWFMYSADRVASGETAKKHVYWRLEEVEDRFGQKIVYEYGDSEISLIPQAIQAVGRSAQRILVGRSSDGRRVESVTDTRGKKTEFTYQAASVNQPGTGGGSNPLISYAYTRLSKVGYPDGTEVEYLYDVVPDKDDFAPGVTYHYHANLKSIEDPLGNKHEFEYEFDRKQKVYSERFTQLVFGASISGIPYNFQQIAQNQLDLMNGQRGSNNPGSYQMQSGLPRLVKRVTLPGTNGHSDFKKSDNSAVKYGPEFEATATTEVTDAAGGKISYVFGGVQGELVNTDTSGLGGVINVAKEWMVYYTSMEVLYYGKGSSVLGKDRFEFNPAAGMSLSKAVDFSGNVTTWEYENPYQPTDVPLLTENPNFMTAWADPTAKVDALGRKETYEYGPHRMLSKLVDVHGSVIDYAIDAKGRRKSTVVHDAGGTKLQEETYLYDDEDGDAASNLPGFMVKKTTKAFQSFSGKPWEQDLVVQSVPDAYGRQARQIVDPTGASIESIFTYDAANNKTSSRDPNGNLTGFEYDDLGRLKKVTHPDASFKSFGYDLSGNKIKEVDENGFATLFERDGLGRVTKTARDLNHNGLIDGADSTTRTVYNSLNQVSQVIDPRGYAVVTHYDGLNRPSDIFQGVPAAQAGGSVGTLGGLALASRAITHDKLSYHTASNTGGGLLSSFRPTQTIRQNAVSADRGATDISLTNTVVYDKIYRQTNTSLQYASGASSTTLFTYGAVDTNGREALVSKATDALGKVTRTTIDGLGRPVEVIDGFGLTDPNLVKTVTTAYTSTGFAWRTIDPLQRHSEVEYDQAGRAVKSWLPDPVTGEITANSPMTETVYDDNGNVTAVIDALGKRTDSEYDVRNRKWRTLAPPVTNAANPDSPVTNVRPTSVVEYDAVGNVIAATDPRGATTRTFYDKSNRPYLVRTNPVSGNPSTDANAPGANDISVGSVYDIGGLVLSVTNGNGDVTRNAYDGLGRLTDTITDPTSGNPVDPAAGGFDPVAYRAGSPTGLLVSNLYDDSGNLIEVTDGKGQRTAFTYDGLARKTRTIWDPDMGVGVEGEEKAEYNALYQTKRVDARQRVTLYLYDAQYRLSDMVYGPVHPATTSSHVDNRRYLYDRVGKVTEVSYPNEVGSMRGVVCSYDLLDRITSETSAGVAHTYPEYDKAGNRKLTVYGRTGTALVSTYDSLNRLVECEERSSALIPSGRVTRYAYDLGSKVTRKTLPNGTATTTSFDKVGRASVMTEKNSSGSVLSSFDYSQPVGAWPGSHDGVGNVLRCAETYSQAGMVNRTVVNTYDHCSRLITETITPAGGSAASTSYAYDRANNRVSKTAGSVVTEYAFGNGGNGANSNQLLSYGPPGGLTTASFTYDANGNRETKVTAAGTETYVWNYENRLEELTVAGGGIYTYAYDYRGRRLVRDESQAGGVKTVLSFSGGLSVQESNAAGVVQSEVIRGGDWGGGVGGILYTVRGSQRSYNAYNSRGDVVSTTDDAGAATWQASYEAFGTRTAEQGTNIERQRANTKEEDPTGLLNEGFRYRDLESGTFISRDPAGFVDGPNVYTYVLQNPWSAFDPDGLEEKKNFFQQFITDVQNIRAVSQFEGGYGGTFGAMKNSVYNDTFAEVEAAATQGAYMAHQMKQSGNGSLESNFTGITYAAFDMIGGKDLMEAGEAKELTFSVDGGVGLRDLTVEEVRGKAVSGSLKLGTAVVSSVSGGVSTTRLSVGMTRKTVSRLVAKTIARGLRNAPKRIPLGFSSADEFAVASREFTEALQSSGLKVSKAGVRGSAVTNVSGKGGPFRAKAVGGKKASDVDFFFELADDIPLSASKSIPGFIHPDKVMKAHPALRAWSEKWTKGLGREVTPGGFKPGTFTDTKIILF